VPWAILDTNVYIGHWELGLYEATLLEVRRRFIVRQSAVVLSELRRGARTRLARRLVHALHEQAPVLWEPTAVDWWEAGKVVRDVGDVHGWERTKRRDFQNDTLIALTARRHGAVVVTDNSADFTILAERLGILMLETD
jgi:predicted nucleic acid-binding protein